MRLRFIFISALFLFQANTFCQLNSRLDLEAGYFNFNSAALNQEENILLRSEGELSYSNSGDFSSFNASARLRPEWYGIDMALRSIKMGAQTSYLREGDSFSYGFSASGARNIYKSYSPAIFHDLVSLQSDFTFSLPLQYVLQFNPGYYRQAVSYENKQTMDVFSLELSLAHSFNNGLKTEGGIYTEGFSIRNLPSEKEQNQFESMTKGVKIGPEINLSLSDKRIASLNYRFLFVSSKETEFPSYEQMVRFLAGIISEDNISVMLLADYYWHKIRVLNGSDHLQTSVLSYSSLNYENRIFIKIGYDMTDNMEVYLRTGYQRENLLYDVVSEKSWSLMFGLSFTN